MAGIFISYRRSDTQDVAGRIFDRLTQQFSQEMVFKDVDSIPLSVPFPLFLLEKVKSSDVVIALIGPDWVSLLERRSMDLTDYVRLEIETAFDLGVPIVPVTVRNMCLPQASNLPEKLKGLAMRQGQLVRPDPDFHRDMDRLIRRLEPFVKYGADATSLKLNRNLLQVLLEAAQGWFNEVVETAARLRYPIDLQEASRVQFTYVNTRKFLPKILSIRKLLSVSGETAKLARAIDEFIQLLTCTEGNDPIAKAPGCLPIRFDPETDIFDAKLNVLLMVGSGIRALQDALQAISDEVTDLLSDSKLGRIDP
jgi:hypothetical protein